eukprot:TRINITY_DN29661_c0_g1_i1.p1 TRINITY_DN29661_c0_g1~~TRINITY_DN29661_c0_g1_i1.p1  ORF type:complete len:411 (+),score=49.95 TRINITY_DN29661_c0_g1_i1:455-1687(+)
MSVIGSFALVRYSVGGPELWHERLILWSEAGAGTGRQVLTPDGDRYREEIGAGVVDLDGHHWLSHQGQLPPGLIEARCYRFRDLPPLLRYRELVAEAHAEEMMPGPADFPGMQTQPPAVVAPVAGGALVAGAAVGIPPGLGDVAAPVAVSPWVFAETAGRAVRGNEVPAADVGGGVLRGRRGLVLVDGQWLLIIHRADLALIGGGGEDLRTLPVRFDAQGDRRRELPDALGLMSDEMPAGGMPLSGPRSVLWTLKYCRDTGGSIANAHDLWVRNGGIPGSDRSVYKHECLSRILEAAVMVDQLNAPALLSMELLVRRMALIKEAHRVSPAAPDYSMSDQFMGWAGRRGGAGVSPELSRHVADELRAQAMVAKEARKAREDRSLRGRGAGRGRGRGGKGGGGAEDAAAAGL